MSVQFEWGKSWLGVFLTQRNVSPELVRLCEEKLVIQEGFCSPLFLMRVNFQIQFFTRKYLHMLGITALGLCEELLCLHQDMVRALAQKRDAMDDTAPAILTCAALPIVLPTSTNDVNVQKKSWLNLFLTENNASDYLIDLCEENLVRKEGFGNPFTLARTSKQYFNHQYLIGQGITILPVREALLAFHSDLNQEFSKHVPFQCHSTNGAEDAARAAVKAVLPGYFDNNCECEGEQSEQGEQSEKQVVQDPSAVSLADEQRILKGLEQVWMLLDEE